MKKAVVRGGIYVAALALCVAIADGSTTSLLGLFIVPTYAGGLAPGVRCKAVVRMTWGGGESVGPWLLVG